MSFDYFKLRVKRRFGGAKFKAEDGKHIAYLPDGIKLVGNAISQSVMVYWGSGHSAKAII